jgi:hypothetical protein
MTYEVLCKIVDEKGENCGVSVVPYDRIEHAMRMYSMHIMHRDTSVCVVREKASKKILSEFRRG